MELSKNAPELHNRDAKDCEDIVTSMQASSGKNSKNIISKDYLTSEESVVEDGEDGRRLLAAYMTSKITKMPIFQTLLKIIATDTQHEFSNEKINFFENKNIDENSNLENSGSLFKKLTPGEDNSGDPLFNHLYDNFCNNISEFDNSSHFNGDNLKESLKKEMVFGELLQVLLNIAINPILNFNVDGNKNDEYDGEGRNKGLKDCNEELIGNVCTFVTTLLKELLLSALKNEARILYIDILVSLYHPFLYFIKI